MLAAGSGPLLLWWRRPWLLVGWTGEGRKLAGAWGAYRNFVAELTNLASAPSESKVLWGELMTAAVALGLAEKVETQLGLERVIPRLNDLALLVVVSGPDGVEVWWNLKEDEVPVFRLRAEGGLAAAGC